MNNFGKNVTVKKEDLLFQIGMALQDYFVATLSQENDYLLMHFSNGQTFTLSIT